METDCDAAGFGSLPEGCISHVLSLTTPRDTCRSAAAGAAFRSAVESDAVWEGFLPADYRDVLARAVEPVEFGRKSFVLEKSTGKKCFMLSARDLRIVWGDTPAYWSWKSSRESRFSEVAELHNVCWLEIFGKLSASMLSPRTTYVAYLVYKVSPQSYGLSNLSQKASISMRPHTSTREVRLLPEEAAAAEAREGDKAEQVSGARDRSDGRMEVALGEFVVDQGCDGQVEMMMLAKRAPWKRVLIVEGIEVRPKNQLVHWKKCFMLSPRHLRFSEVAEIHNVYWLEISGKMNASMLSPRTTYVAYLVYKLIPQSYGLSNLSVKASITMRLHTSTREVRLQPEEAAAAEAREGDKAEQVSVARDRSDGWMEVALGEFVVDQGCDGQVEMMLLEKRPNWKRGLIVEGIEVRPKYQVGMTERSMI